MKKILVLALAITFAFPFKAKADEGMWFLMFLERLNHRDMQKLGLQLTAEEIYSINNHSLKDAIVQFNGGCTAEIISSQGLVLTNHHCGYDKIAELSSPENDYLNNGFWAKNFQEELAPKNISVRFFIRMDDVTNRILSKLNDKMTEAEREKTINQEIALIQKENSEDGKYTVSVRSFFQGNEFYYFVYQDFTDIRLVGTPPNSIGKFGGDTDNWEWPRHTGDFSLFRVYADKDGNPSPYAETNVPYKPKRHLTISLKGIQEGDFAMIMGYPGRTNRWMPSAGIDQNIKFAYPAWVEASKTGMDVMKKHMDQSKEVSLNYASKYAQVANYWKNRQGMIDALTQHQTVQKKKTIEDQFQKWADKKANKTKYGNVLNDINAFYAATNEKARHDNYLSGFLRTSAFAAFPYSLGMAMIRTMDANNGALTEDIKNKLIDATKETFEGLYMPLEKEMMIAQFKLYFEKGNYSGVSQDLIAFNNANKGDFAQIINQAFESSIFTSEEKLLAFINNPTKDAIQNDPMYQISDMIITQYRSTSEELTQLNEAYQKAYRLLVQGLRVSKIGNILYPDANSTLRLTYGSVVSLPEDARNDADVNFYTTLKGTVAKYKPNDEEFDMPAKLIELYNTKDYGQYADAKGHLPVNFLTNNDITGGNSGSPVMNGKGELIGLAFDGNIEAMAGDVIFDPKLQRTINVDIRYVLFIIDKYAGATNIINELTIVK